MIFLGGCRACRQSRIQLPAKGDDFDVCFRCMREAERLYQEHLKGNLNGEKGQEGEGAGCLSRRIWK